MHARRTFAVSALLFLFLALAIPTLSAAATIGLYTDQYGSSCTFSGNAPGLVTAYVVVKPGPNEGLTGARFAAPAPSCLGAVYVDEALQDDVIGIGNSQSGLSVGFRFCATQPQNVLQIRYMRTSTTACCEFVLTPDPIVGNIQGVDCSFNEFTLPSATSHFNADASCPCSDAMPPAPPANPYPPHQSTGVSLVNTTLTWESPAHDGDIIGYDVYFGTTATPPLLTTVTTPQHSLPALQEVTTYFWRVVARDAEGFETSSPTWSFATRPVNYPPTAPSNPGPTNGAAGVFPTVTLSWSAFDLDLDPLKFDIYLGTTNPPQLLVTDHPNSSYSPGTLSFFTTYYWKVVVKDNKGAVTQGSVWSFTTRSSNMAPSVSNPSPSNNASGVATNVTLSWTGSDPENDPLIYEIFLGTFNPPPHVASGITPNTYQMNGLSTGTQYFWRVIALDNQGNQSASSTWSFTTIGFNRHPGPISAVYPLNSTLHIPIDADLSWACTDPDGDALTFDVYFGAAANPPLAVSNHAIKTFDPGSLAAGTNYFWRIVARDPSGLTTQSSTFQFTTIFAGPPSAPFNPIPISGASNVPVNATLSWSATDDTPALLRYDVYFGTTIPPPLVASNVTNASYNPGPLAYSSQYRWRIVARDGGGLETSGPTWTFFTVSPPLATNPVPANNGFAAAPLTLKWKVTRPNSLPVLCDLYFGTTNPPPFIDGGLLPTFGADEFQYAIPGPIDPGTTYYWRVRAYDSAGETAGSVWSFTGALLGDVTGDGLITLADASCALQIAIENPGCAAPGKSILGDVNCEPLVTPRDALCIHRKAIGQTCLFCGESFTIAASPASAIVSRSSYRYEGNVLIVTMAVSGVPNLEAFSFWVRTPPNAPLSSVHLAGATTGFTTLAVNAGSVLSIVGAYSLTPGAVSSTTNFLELRFVIGGSLTGLIFADSFGDDLAGASALVLMEGSGKGGGGTPVAFSRFDAVADDGAVRINWELQADDVMESYSLYRREQGTTAFTPINEGSVTRPTGSFVDRAVDAGKRYQYELKVLAGDGDEFFSPIITVEIPALGISLGANHPNPFNPQTTIPYHVPAGGSPVRVRLVIYDTSGRAVRVLVDEEQNGGPRDIVWNGTDSGGKVVTSGIYFCVLQVGKERRTQKLVLLK